MRKIIKNKFNLVVFMVLMFMVTFVTPVLGDELCNCNDIYSLRCREINGTGSMYVCKRINSEFCYWTYDSSCATGKCDNSGWCLDYGNECTPNKNKCTNNKLYTCTDFGYLDLYSAKDCPGGCNYEQSACLVPNPNEECSTNGSWMCNSGYLYDCSNHKWTKNEPCPSFECNENYTYCSEGDFPEPEDELTRSDLIPRYPGGFLFEDRKPGDVVSRLLPYVYVIAGIILLVMLVTGGLGLMTAAGNPDKMKAGYGKITNSLIGFLIIFISYFVVQLIETVLSIKIF